MPRLQQPRAASELSSRTHAVRERRRLVPCSARIRVRVVGGMPSCPLPMELKQLQLVMRAMRQVPRHYISMLRARLLLLPVLRRTQPRRSGHLLESQEPRVAAAIASVAPLPPARHRPWAPPSALITPALRPPPAAPPRSCPRPLTGRGGRPSGWGRCWTWARVGRGLIEWGMVVGRSREHIQMALAAEVSWWWRAEATQGQGP